MDPFSGGDTDHESQTRSHILEDLLKSTRWRVWDTGEGVGESRQLPWL